MNLSKPPLPEAVTAALELMRAGDMEGARARIDAALVEDANSIPLLELAGLVAARAGELPAAIARFGQILEIEPDHPVARVNLATALIQTEDFERAAEVCAGRDDIKLQRIAGYAYQQIDRPADAVTAYEAVVGSDPDDFETWNNLGNARAAVGDSEAATAAFDRAIRLKPDLIPAYMNYSEILAQAEQPAARQRIMRQATGHALADPAVHTELGLAEAGMHDFAAAERAFREAIRLTKGFTPAFLDLGLLLENLNRVDDLVALAAEADARELKEPEADFIRAWALRRQGRFEEAMPLAMATPLSINPIRRTQLIAELADRLGDTDSAFPAFVEMNARAVAAKPAREAPIYREKIAADAALLTAERVAQWRPIEVAVTPPPPVFIVGFPRSGTTLLDTLLMNMNEFHVLEERPVLQAVAKELGGEEMLPELTSEQADGLRARYFEELDAIAPCPANRIVVDKHPLHMARMPLIHRIFPDAKIVFVERHPCDVVLSCFMANFQLNHAMRSFTDLKEAALTYDAVSDNWTRAELLLPLRVHRIRYERMIEDLEAEMRPLLDFLETPWRDDVLDNRASAAKRGHIRTASYSQVTEPIYGRAVGRWERYREQMAPVLPILEPWVQRMDYPI